MEKTNFTPNPLDWIKTLGRTCLMVAICFGFTQNAQAAHVVGPQPSTNWLTADPSTATLITPGEDIIFTNGLTAIIEAQGMNCGAMTYNFYDAGGLGAPFSDEGMDVAFTICPGDALAAPGRMTQFLSVNIGELFLGPGEMLTIYDGDDTDASDPVIGTFGDTDTPGVVTAGSMAGGDGSLCLTFELTGLDRSSDAEGFSAVVTATEFQPSVECLPIAFDANRNGNFTDPGDRAEVDEVGVGIVGNGIVEIATCNSPIPDQNILVDFGCGIFDAATGTANPFFTYNVSIGGAVVATGSASSADPQSIPVMGTALNVGENDIVTDLVFTNPASGTTIKATCTTSLIVATADPLVCNDDLNIGLDADCNVNITPDVLLEAPCAAVDPVTGLPIAAGYNITVTLVSADRNYMGNLNTAAAGFGIVNNNTETVQVQIPGRYRYTIRLGDNVCWGFFNLEDKRGPICAPAGDLELRTTWDIDCDGVNERFQADPSGVDDLAPEFILCTVLERDGVELYFDQLEAMDVTIDLDGDNTGGRTGDVNGNGIGDQVLLGDFFDCTGIQTVFFRDVEVDVCSLENLAGFPIPQTITVGGVQVAPYDVNLFEISKIYSRTWFAIDKNGYQSTQGCTQYVYGLRPKANNISLDPEASADCGDVTFDANGDPVFSAAFNVSVAPYFSVNNNIVNNGLGSGFIEPGNFRNGPGGAITNADIKRYILTPNEHTCNYAVSFHQDPLITICSGGFKLLRHWSVVDWCDGDRVYDEFTQLVKVEDTEAPMLVIPGTRTGMPTPNTPAEINFVGGAVDTIVGTKLFDCEASGNIPLLELSDNCSDATLDRITIQGLGLNDHGQSVFFNDFRVGGVPANGGALDGLDLLGGRYTVTYFFSDDCGNADTKDVIIGITDTRAPVARCNDELKVTLIPTGVPGEQAARICGEDLDEGSSDNCFPIIYEVRRGDGTNQPWTECVEFNCADVSDDDLKIELRVTEDRNGNGVKDAGELSNVCWGIVDVEDKTPPTIGVENQRLRCDDLNLRGGNLQLVEGILADNDPFPPAILGGCNADGIEIEVTRVDATAYDDVCNFGTLVRDFRATRIVHDNTITSNTVRQVIVVDFISNWTMTFPVDQVVVCDPNADTEIPEPLRVDEILTNNGCDQWGMEVVDQVFDIIGQDGDGACFKVVREYRFVNWCTWDVTNTELGIVNRPEGLILEPSAAVQLRHRSRNFGRNAIDDGDPDNNADTPTDADIYDEITPTTTVFSADANVVPNAWGDDGALVILDGSVFIGGNDNPQQTLPLFTRQYVEQINQNDVVTGVYAENYGYFAYRQIIKVVDNENPVPAEIDDLVVCDTLGLCAADVELPMPFADECKPTYTVRYSVDINGDGDTNDANESRAFVRNDDLTFRTRSLSGLPIGTYTVTYRYEDGCGNAATDVFDIDIRDCKAPTAYCIFGLSIDLMTTGMVDIWANDFDRGSADDCSGPVQLSFSPNPADSGRIFTCDDVGTVSVDLYVTDAVGNQAFCTTFVVIQPNDAADCDDATGALVSGSTRTESEQDVEGVSVKLSGASSATAATGVNGGFEFTQLTVGNDYTVTPEKDVNPLNGVSTFDLVLIRKHIIGVDLLDSPYKLIAADVNNSGTVTTFDMVELRKLILGIDTEFEGNTSWRFVDKAYAFPNPANPWVEEFPEVVNFNDIQASDIADFIAVKVGDVNGSAIPNNLLGSDDRNVAGTLALTVAEQAIVAGKDVTVDFTAADLANVAGYQFTLNFDNEALELVEIIEGAAKADNFGTTLASEGVITTSWDGAAEANEVLFSLVFAATADANLSELLSVSSRYTKAEAYTTNADLLDVALNFGGNATAATFELYQNTPNPFKGITTISFNMAEAGTATLKVHDVTGKVMKLVRGDFAKGFNNVKFAASDLQATGVLYYTLETANDTATKKMIIIE